MAMSPVPIVNTVSPNDLNNILNKIILPGIEDMLPNDTVWYKIAERKMMNMVSNQFYFTVRTGRNTGIAAVTENNKVPVGKASFSQANASAKFVFGGFNISDQALAGAKGQPGSLEEVLSLHGKYTRIDMARKLNRYFWKAGDGVLAIATSSTASSGAHSFTISNYQGVTVAGDVAIRPSKYLEVGGKYLCGASRAAASLVLTITGITTGTTTDTITATSATGAVSVGDFLYDVDGDSAIADEPMGAQGIVDDGTLTGSGLTGDIPTAVSTFEGIVRSTNDFWKAGITTMGGALTEAAMATTFLKAREYGNPELIFMNQKLFAKYGNLLATYKKTASTKEVQTGGFTGNASDGSIVGLEFAAGGQGATVVLDYDCPDREVYFIDPSSIKIAQLAGMQWLDDGKGNVLRFTDYANYQAILKWYGNLVCTDVRANAKIITATV